MERHEEPGHFPDLCNAVDIQTLLCLARIMLRDKPCVVSHCGCQNVDTGCGSKLLGLFRRGQGQSLRRLLMNLGTCSDFADLSLDQDRRVDGF